MKFLPLAIAAAIALTACDKASKEAKADPVALLKAKAAALEGTERDEVWGGLAYDVQKTDSLVSPYQGFITGTISTPPSAPAIAQHETAYKVTLAFQDQKWVVQDIQGTFVLKDAPNDKQPMHSGTKQRIQMKLGN